MNDQGVFELVETLLHWDGQFLNLPIRLVPLLNLLVPLFN